jgi:hypothetical protein
MNPVAAGLLSTIFGMKNTPASPLQALTGTGGQQMGAGQPSGQLPQPKTPTSHWQQKGPLSMVFGMGK